MVLRVLDERAHTLQLFDLGRFDLDVRKVRTLLLANLLRSVDDEPTAVAVEVSVDGEPIEVLGLDLYELDDASGIDRFYADLFDAIDVVGGPPKSGVRCIVPYQPA